MRKRWKIGEEGSRKEYEKKEEKKVVKERYEEAEVTVDVREDDSKLHTESLKAEISSRHRHQTCL